MRIKNTLLTAMAVAVLFNAVSCSESGPVTTTLETSGTYMLSEGSEAELDLKIDIEYLISGLDEERLGNINRTLTSAMFEEMPSDMSIEEAVAAYKDRKKPLPHIRTGRSLNTERSICPCCRTAHMEFLRPPPAGRTTPPGP